MDPVILVLLVMLVTSGVAFLAVIFFWMLVGSDQRQSEKPRSLHPSMKVAPGSGYSGRATPGRATSDSGVDSTSMWIATDFGGVSTGSHHCSSSGSSWGGGDCGGGGSSGGGDCGGGGGGGGGCD